MITDQEEKYILERAYVPEHIVPLMVGISGAEPFLAENYLFFSRDDWMIFIGYPLEGEFKESPFAALLEKSRKEFRSVSTWFIAPQVPRALRGSPGQENDEYYKIDLKGYEPRKDLKRIVRKAAQVLALERSRALSSEHTLLTREFLAAEEGMNPRVQELFLRLPRYVSHSKSSLVLSARDEQGRLSAFYVVELGAKHFATYVAGCFSRKHYVPHASDFLFHEMVRVARENQKECLHLGLGVNEGIRRFKRKWGGAPFLKYASGEWSQKPKGLFAWVEALQGKI